MADKPWPDPDDPQDTARFEDWQLAVAEGSTVLGFRPWVENQAAMAELDQILADDADLADLASADPQRDEGPVPHQLRRRGDY
jgi:hypothetical protein